MTKIPIFISLNDNVKSCPYCNTSYVYSHICKRFKKIIRGHKNQIIIDKELFE